MYKKKNTKQFNYDSEWGTYWEFETIPFIENYFNKVLEPKGKKLIFLNENMSRKVSELKEWDMKYAIIDTFTNQILKTITFEIKADKYDKTGNLIFEKTCSKKLSGVFATKADYFVYYLPRYTNDNFYLVKPKDLINLINEKFSSCINYGGGDGGRVVSYLVSKNTFDEEYTSNKSCKLLTCNLEIPSKFGVNKFEEKKCYTYYSEGKMKKYDDDLDF
ncbi:hypothetical protein [Flavobacterium sp.]|uniref:hypothetical protein n=1 Tax=Flavobacterium sp. TaxID=239 RepID=UPI002FDD76EC